MPIKYAVPAGSARIKLLIALAARYTGEAARGWDEWDGLDIHPAFQNSGRFGYSFGKTRVLGLVSFLTPVSSLADEPAGVTTGFSYTLAELEEMIDASPQVQLLTAKQEGV